MDHYWLDLPGPIWFSAADIYRRFVAFAEGPAIAVELGAWKGRSACFMGVEIANSGKPIDFYAVDHWQGSAGEAEHDSDPDVRAGRLYEVFLANTAPVAEQVKPIRSDSAAAASQFADASIDFLYIDANHSYERVLRDLIAWYPKVKPGGLIAGDDWCFADAGELGVRHAVLDFFGPSAARLAVEPGSEPNPHWLQWSVVKSPDLRVASSARLVALRAFRSAGRSVRALKSTLRR